MSPRYAGDKRASLPSPCGPAGSPIGGDVASRPGTAGRLSRLRGGGNGSVRALPAGLRGAPETAGRSPDRPARATAAATRPAGVVRAVLGCGEGRVAPAQVRGREKARGSTGRGDGGAVARGRRGWGAAGACPGSRSESATAWLRPGSPTRCRCLAGAEGSVASHTGEDPTHLAAVRAWPAGAPDERSRRLRASKLQGSGRGRREMDRPRGRRSHDWIDSRGLRRGALRSGSDGGGGSDGCARALSRRRVSPAHGTGFYTCRVAAAHLRAPELGRVLGRPDAGNVRCGGQP